MFPQAITRFITRSCPSLHHLHVLLFFVTPSYIFYPLYEWLNVATVFTVDVSYSQVIVITDQCGLLCSTSPVFGAAHYAVICHVRFAC